MLTRHGWAAAAAAAGAFAAGRIFGLVELYVLGAALGVTVALAVATVRLPVPVLSARRRVDPPLVAVGEPLRVELAIRNDGTRRSPALRLWEPVGERGGAVMQVAAIRSGDAATAAYRVPTDRRGTVEIGPLTAERHDPFALARRLVDVPGSVVAVVVPRHADISMPEPGRGGPLAQLLASKALGRSGTDFHSQREYVPGDDTRRINWKASARTDELIVTEREAERLRRCTVALVAGDPAFDDRDDASPQPDDAAEAFETAVSVAASVVLAAGASGIATRLVAPDLDLAGRDIALEALRSLATVAPSPSPLDPRALSGAEDGLGLVVLVSGTPAAGRAVLASMTAAPDDAIVLVCVAADGREADPDVVQTPVVRSGGAWTLRARSLDAFAAAWRQLVESPS